MGKSVVILGAQWGDEGKGKIVDLLTDRAKYVVRYQGGHNAGHTLIINGEKTVLRARTFIDFRSLPVNFALSCCDGSCA